MLWHGQGGDEKRLGWDGAILRKMGGWGCRLTLGSGSQSQTVGLGVGLLSNWYVSWCWKTPTSSQKNKIIPSTWNPLPIISQHSNISPCSPFGITPGPLWFSLSSSLHLCAAIASRRGLALSIDDLPDIISLQLPILFCYVILIFSFYC